MSNVNYDLRCGLCLYDAPNEGGLMKHFHDQHPIRDQPLRDRIARLEQEIARKDEALRRAESVMGTCMCATSLLQHGHGHATNCPEGCRIAAREAFSPLPDQQSDDGLYALRKPHNDVVRLHRMADRVIEVSNDDGLPTYVPAREIDIESAGSYCEVVREKLRRAGVPVDTTSIQ